MALGAHFDIRLHQMDVRTTFLNGDINEIKFYVQRETLHQATQMVCKINEIHLWTQAGISTMVFQV